MSRGKLGFLTSLILLGMVFLNPSSVSAQLTISGLAAGTDDLRPGPVAAVIAGVDLTVPSITVTWTLSDDDFVRQAPTGTDFTSGGAFTNVNDVAGYKVWRDDGNGAVVIDILGSGEIGYEDLDVTNGVNYTYSVTVIDAAGNESDPVSSELVVVGSPPTSEPVPPVGAQVLKTISLTFNNAANAAVDNALALVLEIRVPPPASPVPGVDPPPLVDLTEVIANFDIPEADKAEIVIFVNDFRTGLCATLGADFDCSRIVITGLSQGSIVVDFVIVDDPENPDATPTAEVIADLEVLVEEDPEALNEALAAVVGPVSDFGSVTSGDLDMGVVGLDGTASEDFSFNNNATEDDAILSLQIEVTGDGFSTDATSLLIESNGGTGTFTVTFDAAEVNSLNGAYDGVLTIQSNDPNNRLTVINLSATIEDGNSAQRIDLIGSAFPFGNVATGTTQARTMTVRNLGDLDLSGTLALDGDAAFAIDESSFLLAGGEGLGVTIEFSPTGEVDYSATITITSDDPNEPELTVPLSGSGTSGEEALLETDTDGNLVTDDDGNFVIILGDFDGTADVGFQDFFIFADNFGADDLTDPDVNAATDLDDSGDVGFQDFFIFADNFGKSGIYQVLGSSATAFSATLSGDQQNPAVTSSAAGSGTFSLNAAETELTFSIIATGVTDFTAAHFHNAAADANGGVVRGFDAAEITDDGAGNITISGTWSSTDGSALTEALVDELEAGNIYVNIHTTTNGSGEIRGQVIED
jgi:hypothetical protein